MIEPQPLVAGTTNVAGSSGVFAVTGTLSIYQPWTTVPHGAEVPYSAYDADNYEMGEATVAQAGGVTTLTRTRLDRSSTGSAITWPPGGVRNLVCDHVAPHLQNHLADYPDPDACRDNIFAKARLATGLTGGSSNTVVRANGAGAVTAAANTDAPATLWPLWWKGPDGALYESGGLVPGTFTAGQRYWLGTAGALLTSAPAASTTVTAIELGYAISAAEMKFDPPPPAVIPRLVVPAWAGGSNSNVVRYVAGGTVTAADKNDSAELLMELWCRGSDGELYPPRSFVPFASVTDGQAYYVGTAGALRTTPGIAGDAFNTICRVGSGRADNVLWFNPQPPVGAVTSSGVAIVMESGSFRA